jgi:hypothetical protein
MPNTETVSLEHKFSDQEIAVLARKQSEALNEIASLEDRLSSFKKQIGSTIDEKKANIRGVSQKIQTGSEWRDIRCLFLKEQPVGWRIGIRLDTARIVKARRLRHDERQMELTEGQEVEHQVASTILQVDAPDLGVEVLEVFLTQKELEVLVDADGFCFTLLPEQTEAAEATPVEHVAAEPPPTRKDRRNREAEAPQ